MTTRLVIIGAGGFGREVLDVVEAINLDHAARGEIPFEVLGFVADGTPEAAPLAAYDAVHLGPVAELEGMDPDVGYVIGIGWPQGRRRIDEQFKAHRESPVLIHPSATYHRAVTLVRARSCVPGCG